MIIFIKKHGLEIFQLCVAAMIAIVLFFLILNFQEYGGFRQIIIDAGRDVLSIIEEIKK